MLVESESQGCQQGLEGKIEVWKSAWREKRDRLPAQRGRAGRGREPGRGQGHGVRGGRGARGARGTRGARAWPRGPGGTPPKKASDPLVRTCFERSCEPSRRLTSECHVNFVSSVPSKIMDVGPDYVLCGATTATTATSPTTDGVRWSREWRWSWSRWVRNGGGSRSGLTHSRNWHPDGNYLRGVFAEASRTS